MADGEHAHEIIIIKRHGDHEEGHHGGVWKIAFADFMTAMMAFFLVMWLISANDKTKATIASYFNPVKLVDTTTQPKGLEDAKAVESTQPSTKGAKSAPTKETPKEKPKGEAESPKAGGEESAAKTKEKRMAAAVLDDPYAALTEIAGQKGTAAPPTVSASPKTMPHAITHKGGEAFRDPFAPPPPLQQEVESVPSDIAEAEPKPAPPGGHPDIPGVSPAKGEAATESGTSLTGQKGKTANVEATGPAAELKAQLVAAAKSTGLDKAGPQIDVRKTDGGLLISLTDSADFEMFSTGSAVPARKVVLMMDRVAEVLKAKPGKVVVRGYTDSRPYKNGKYDNWRLSVDRAQVMHYMLVRGGMDEGRIAHIEGYADRNLKSAADPTAAINRRIEILVKEETP